MGVWMLGRERNSVKRKSFKGPYWQGPINPMDAEIKRRKAEEWREKKRLRACVDGRLRQSRLRAARLKGTHTDEEWKRLVAACYLSCVRCLRYGGKLSKDHIVPIYLGGSDAISNLQPLCQHCNGSKFSESYDWRPPDWAWCV